jgi:hypothetical protein
MRVLSALALLVLASAGQSQPPGKGGVAPPEKVRWEYAELSVRTGTPFPRDADERPKSSVTIRWTTDKEEQSFTGYADFAEKVKVGGFKKDAPTTHQRIQVLNHLGNEGWELAESGSMTSGVAILMTCNRPATERESHPPSPPRQT